MLAILGALVLCFVLMALFAVFASWFIRGAADDGADPQGYVDRHFDMRN